MDGARPSQDMDVLPREKRLPADRARRPTGARTSFLRRSRARRVRCALRRWRADIAKVAELADAPALGAGAARRGGSSPPFRTTQRAGSAPRGRSPCSGLETVCPVSSYLALDRTILARTPTMRHGHPATKASTYHHPAHRPTLHAHSIQTPPNTH